MWLGPGLGFGELLEDLYTPPPPSWQYNTWYDQKRKLVRRRWRLLVIQVAVNCSAEQSNWTLQNK